MLKGKTALLVCLLTGGIVSEEDDDDDTLKDVSDQAGSSAEKDCCGPSPYEAFCVPDPNQHWTHGEYLKKSE
jgi:hypothetical protein